MKALIVLFLMLCATCSAAEKEKREFIHRTKDDITAGDRAIAFGALYTAQWSFYLWNQHEAVLDHGSWHNWTHNPLRPHFDKDTIDYNIFLHSIAGNYYYLYYRSLGYTAVSAFLWSAASSAAFEFSIETLTEPPSFQDLYQTPVLGSLLGMSMEWASNSLHSIDTWPAHALGYLLNPFSIFPFSAYGFQARPVIGKGEVGAFFTFNLRL